MWVLILRRVAAMGFSILFLTALIFVLMQAVFGDPVVAMLGRDADPDTIARLRQDLGLDRPVYVQYRTGWAGSPTATGGARSARVSPCSRRDRDPLPLSLELAFLSLLLAVVLALVLGTLDRRPPAHVGGRRRVPADGVRHGHAELLDRHPPDPAVRAPPPVLPSSGSVPLAG